MSQKIAPGKWDANTRMTARYASWMFGAVLLLAGVVKWLTTPEIGLYDAVLIGGSLMLSGAAVFPTVVVPLMYRLIDKFMTDTRGSRSASRGSRRSEDADDGDG